MFAKIGCQRGYHRILAYNELKVNRHRAECVLAKGFLKDAQMLSRADKAFHFEFLTSRNERSALNSAHISISYFPEDRCSEKKFLPSIVEYMDRIGLGYQPYLVYQHNDTRHPHFHIVTTNIQYDGSRINLWEALMSKSFEVTRALEKSYGLQMVESRSESISKRAVYGEASAKSEISKVLETVMGEYQYRNLAELNAVLGLYNVRAYDGQEGSRLRQKGGLMYGMLDGQGKAIGMPIKASAFEDKPTLKRLQEKFDHCQPVPEKVIRDVKIAIDWTLRTLPHDLTSFTKVLRREGISARWEWEREGILKNIYYIDFKSNFVVDGASLGPGYDKESILKRCIKKEELKQEETLKHRLRLNVS